MPLHFSSSDNADQFGYTKVASGKDIKFMVVEKSAAIKFDERAASRAFSPSEVEALDSYMIEVSSSASTR